jgi:hypothetical protein
MSPYAITFILLLVETLKRTKSGKTSSPGLEVWIGFVFAYGLYLLYLHVASLPQAESVIL